MIKMYISVLPNSGPQPVSLVPPPPPPGPQVWLVLEGHKKSVKSLYLSIPYTIASHQPQTGYWGVVSQLTLVFASPLHLSPSPTTMKITLALLSLAAAATAYPMFLLKEEPPLDRVPRQIPQEIPNPREYNRDDLATAADKIYHGPPVSICSEWSTLCPFI